MDTAEVDYLIIGAGIAGTVLQRFLHSDSVALIDHNPGQYKIGESIIPEHFHHPVLRSLVPAAKQLPSYSPKHGSIFVSGDSAASFPLPSHGADVSMHVARDELEALMHEQWASPIIREKVIDLDLEDRIVTTNSRRYQVARQIIDCSGPAMVVARHCRQIRQLWPTWARWAYLDIEEVEDHRFWSHVRDQKLRYRRYDIPNGILLDADEDPDWLPSLNTILTQLNTESWAWQIPLFNRSVLSVGVVSRSGMPSDEDLFDAALHKCPPVYRLRRRQGATKHWLDRIHTRASLARLSETLATDAYILLADAAGFADPIYSVGTGLAVNKAIDLAAELNGEGWTSAALERYTTDYARLFDRAVKAFHTWYSGELLNSPDEAKEVQHGFLIGSAFQVGIANHYSRVLVDAGPSSSQDGPDDPGRHQIDFDEGVVTAKVAQLLQLPIEQCLAGWRLIGAYRTPTEIQHRWAYRGKPELVVNTSFDPSTTRYYRRIGDISLSFMNLWDGEYPMDAACVDLFDELEARIASHPEGWHQLTQTTT